MATGVNYCMAFRFRNRWRVAIWANNATIGRHGCRSIIHRAIVAHCRSGTGRFVRNAIILYHVVVIPGAEAVIGVCWGHQSGGINCIGIISACCRCACIAFACAKDGARRN